MNYGTGEHLYYKCVGSDSIEICEARLISRHEDILFMVNSDNVAFLLDVQDIVDPNQVELWKELSTVVKVRKKAEVREEAIRRKLI